MREQEYLSYRNRIQQLHTELIGHSEMEVALLSTLLERAQKNLDRHKSLLYMMLRYDAGLLTAEESAHMFSLMQAASEKDEAIKAPSDATRKPSTSSANKRSRKRGLQDEVIKPTDDLM